MKSAIKYVELKTDDLRGIGRIVRVNYFETGKTIYWDDRTLVPLEELSYNANYFDDDTLEEFWVSNPCRDGNDSLLPAVIEIEDDIREKYWTEIRRDPSRLTTTNISQLVKLRPNVSVMKNLLGVAIDRRFRAR